MTTFVAGIGMVLFLIGGACMDSPNMAIPVAAVLAGLALVAIAVKKSTVDGFGE